MSIPIQTKILFWDCPASFFAPAPQAAREDLLLQPKPSNTINRASPLLAADDENPIFVEAIHLHGSWKQVWLVGFHNLSV